MRGSLTPTRRVELPRREHNRNRQSGRHCAGKPRRRIGDRRARWSADLPRAGRRPASSAPSQHRGGQHREVQERGRAFQERPLAVQRVNQPNSVANAIAAAHWWRRNRRQASGRDPSAGAKGPGSGVRAPGALASGPQAPRPSSGHWLHHRFRQSLAGRNPAAFASASLVKTRVQFRHVKFGQLDA